MPVFTITCMHNEIMLLELIHICHIKHWVRFNLKMVRARFWDKVSMFRNFINSTEKVYLKT